MRFKLKMTVLTIVSLLLLNVTPADAASAKPIRIASVSADGAITHLQWSGSSLAKGDSYVIALFDASGKAIKSNFKTTATAYDLKLLPYHSYKVQVQTARGLRNLWSAIATFKSAGPAVTNLAVSTSSYTSVTLNWDAMPGATSYKVAVDGSSVKTTAANTFSITDLAPGYSGNVIVTPVGNGTSGAPSEPLAISTSNAAPAFVVAKNISANGFILSWNAVPDATSYNIYADGVLAANSLTSVYTFTGLAVGKSASYTVRALFGKSETVDSTPVVVSTSVIAPPTDLISKNIGETSFTLSWTGVPDATLYNIYADGVLIDTSTVTSDTLTGLSVGSSAAYTVRGIVGKYITTDSLPIKVTTLINAPGVPTVTATTGTSVTVTWSKNANAKDFILSIFDPTGNYPFKATTLDSSLLAYTVTGLSPATIYTVGVQAVYANGTSPVSALATFTTPAPAPSGLTASAITSSAFLLSWTASPGVFAYEIYRDGALVNKISDPFLTSLSMTGLAPGGSYAFTMKAYYFDNSKNTAASAFSNTLLVAMLTDPSGKPSNNSIPVITLPFGTTPNVGATITGSTGTWVQQVLNPVFSVQWQRSVDGGNNFLDIAGANQSSYVVSASDLGFILRYKVVASNVNGSTTVYSNNSLAVGAVFNVGAPVVFGNIVVGQTLQTTDGTWSSTYQITLSYQWLRGGSNISGATSPSYTLTNTDLGQSITVTVTASTTFGSATVTAASRGNVAAIANTVPPVVSGTARVGSTLTTTNGSWLGSPDSYAYQWQSSSDGAVWNLISGATNASYTLVATDAGLYVRAQVFAVKTISSVAYRNTANTLATSQVPALNLINTAQPTIAGAWAVASVLTATTGSWNALGTISYQWQSSSDASTWTNISGATASSITLASAQNGLNIRVQVQNSTTGGDGLAYSAYTPKVGAAVCSVLPAITGTARVGVAQSVTSGTWTTSPTFTYQWQKTSDGIAWTNIGSATAATYTPTYDVANLSLRVVVLAVNSTDTVTVASNTVSGFLPPLPTAIPTITGTATSGQTLTAASPGTWPSTSSGYNYQWQRSSDGTNWTNISGATATTYVLAAGDVGYVVRVQVIVSTNAGTSAAYSLATATVS